MKNNRTYFLSELNNTNRVQNVQEKVMFNRVMYTIGTLDVVWQQVLLPTQEILITTLKFKF